MAEGLAQLAARLTESGYGLGSIPHVPNFFSVGTLPATGLFSFLSYELSLSLIGPPDGRPQLKESLAQCLWLYL